MVNSLEKDLHGGGDIGKGDTSDPQRGLGGTSSPGQAGWENAGCTERLELTTWWKEPVWELGVRSEAHWGQGTKGGIRAKDLGSWTWSNFLVFGGEGMAST